MKSTCYCEYHYTGIQPRGVDIGMYNLAYSLAIFLLGGLDIVGGTVPIFWVLGVALLSLNAYSVCSTCVSGSHCVPILLTNSFLVHSIES